MGPRPTRPNGRPQRCGHQASSRVSVGQQERRVSEDKTGRMALANQDALRHTWVWQKGPMQPFTSSTPAPLRRSTER